MSKVRFKLRIVAYTTIEDKIPYYQSILDDSNKERVKDGLKEINNDIKDGWNRRLYFR